MGRPIKKNKRLDYILKTTQKVTFKHIIRFYVE